MSSTFYKCMTPGCEKFYITSNPDIQDLDYKVQCSDCSRIPRAIEKEILFNKCVDSFPTRKEKIEFIEEHLEEANSQTLAMPLLFPESDFKRYKKMIMRHPLFKFTKYYPSKQS